VPEPGPREPEPRTSASDLGRAELDSVIEVTPDAIIVVTSDYRVVRFNPAAARLYGREASAVLGQPVWVLWGRLDREERLAHIDAVLGGEVVGPLIAQRERPDGTAFQVSLVGLPVRRDDGRVVAAHWQSRDVSAEERARRALESAMDRFTRAFDSSPIGMDVVSFDGVTGMVNPAMLRMLGLTLEEHKALDGVPLHHPDEAAEAAALLERLRSGEIDTHTGRRRLRHKDGHFFWTEECVCVLSRDPDNPWQLLYQIRDISADVAQEQQLQRLADHDDLTGLLSRRAFGDAVEARLAGSRVRTDALLVVDLDDFKHHNDTYGHDVGDAILTAVARQLVGRLRPDDILGRLGGDEFAVLLADVTDDDAEAVASDLLDHIVSAAAAVSPDTAKPVTASIGVADADPGLGLGGLLRRSDQAMYRAKQAGRNRWSR